MAALVTISTHLLIFFLVSMVMEAAGAPAVNTTLCDFRSQYPRPKMEMGSCRTSLEAMVQCLTYLLEQVPQPTNTCCAEVANSWQIYPQCVCKLTFYPPGKNISSHVADALPGLCHLEADLCGICPALLGLIPGMPFSFSICSALCLLVSGKV